MTPRTIYLDNAATTQISPRVFGAMRPWLGEQYGNPSSVYRQGREGRRAVEQARRQLADALGADPGEIYFTSGGSEADNWALKGTMATMARMGKTHLITTNFEHHAIGHTAQALAEQYTVTCLPVNAAGLVEPAQVAAAIRPETALVSVMYANNEIGTVQPVGEIAAICRDAGVLLHSDAVQAVGHIPVDVDRTGVDMLSLSAHKFHGPKGVGALYIRRGIPFPENLIHGGSQERDRRAGTENLVSIVGMGAAICEACENMAGKLRQTTFLRDYLIRGILEIPHSCLNGHPTRRLPGNVNVSFAGVDGSAMLLLLDGYGIAASTGSACTSGDTAPSHVLTAIGLPPELARGSLRLTLGEYNTRGEIDQVLRILPGAVRKLREFV